MTLFATNSGGQFTRNAIALNIGTLSPQYDANGNLTTDGQVIFSYDSDNQLFGIVVTNLLPIFL